MNFWLAANTDPLDAYIQWHNRSIPDCFPETFAYHVVK